MYEHYIPKLLIRRLHLAIKLLDKFISHPKSQIPPDQFNELTDIAYIYYQKWEAEQYINDQQEYSLEKAVTPAKPSQRQLENERIKELADGFEKHFLATA